MERKADFAGILGETFSLVGDAIRGFLMFVVVVGGLNVAGIALSLVRPQRQLVGFDIGFLIDANAGLATAGFQLLSVVVSVIASYLLLSHFLEVRGRLPDRETRILAYVGMNIVSVLCLILGFLLLIVPGLILLVRWSAASGFLIGARKGVIESLTASWEATKGHGWSIFGAGLVLVIGLSVIGGVLGGVGAFLGSPTGIAILSSFANEVGTAIFLAFAIAIFLLVHSDAGEIGEVFA